MANDFIGLDEPATIDKKVDTESLVVGVNTVHRERLQIAGATDTAIAGVTSAEGLDVDVTRIAAGDNNIGNVDIVTMPSVTISAFPDNEPFNMNQLAGTALATPFDVDSGAGTQNVVGVSMRKAASGGSVEYGTSTDPIRIDPTGVTTQNVAGTKSNNGGAPGATNLGTLPAVANAAAPTQTEGNQVALRTTLAGDLAMTLDGEAVVLGAGAANIGDVDVLTIAAGDNNIGNVDIVTMPNVTLAAGTNTNEVVGDAAHDAPSAGNPVLLGVHVNTPQDAAPANRVSADADAARLLGTRDGAIFVHPHGAHIWDTSNEYTTAQTDTEVRAAPGVGLSLYITDITIVCNAAVTVTIEQGTTTLKFRYYGSGQGDGVVANFVTPKKIAANTNITVTTSAAVTVFVGINGYTAP